LSWHCPAHWQSRHRES